MFAIQARSNPWWGVFVCLFVCRFIRCFSTSGKSGNWDRRWKWVAVGVIFSLGCWTGLHSSPRGWLCTFISRWSCCGMCPSFHVVSNGQWRSPAWLASTSWMSSLARGFTKLWGEKGQVCDESTEIKCEQLFSSVCRSLLLNNFSDLHQNPDSINRKVFKHPEKCPHTVVVDFYKSLHFCTGGNPPNSALYLEGVRRIALCLSRYELQIV